MYSLAQPLLLLILRVDELVLFARHEMKNYARNQVLVWLCPGMHTFVRQFISCDRSEQTAKRRGAQAGGRLGIELGMRVLLVPSLAGWRPACGLVRHLLQLCGWGATRSAACKSFANRLLAAAIHHSVCCSERVQSRLLTLQALQAVVCASNFTL